MPVFVDLPPSSWMMKRIVVRVPFSPIKGSHQRALISREEDKHSIHFKRLRKWVKKITNRNKIVNVKSSAISRQNKIKTRPSFSSYNNRAPGGLCTNVYTNALEPIWTSMMNWWWINGKKKYYRLANQTRKTRTFQRDVLDHDCTTMLCFKVVLQLVFFFFKLAWASVTILGSKLIFRAKNLWNNTCL